MSTIINATTTNGVVIQPDNSGSLVLQTNSGTTALTIDTSQNVGIGVTPSAWNSRGKAIQLGNGSINTSLFSLNSGLNGLANNAYVAASTDNYIATGEASRYYQYAGTHVWDTATSGTAGNAITFTERMRIDSSGNVGIGTSSPVSGCKLTALQSSNGQCISVGDGNAIDSGFYGVLQITRQATPGDNRLHIAMVRNGNIVGGFGYVNGSNTMFVGNSGATNSNGMTLTNAATAWGSQSDERVKNIHGSIENAVEKIGEWRTVYFNYKIDEKGSKQRVGLIAQDVEKTAPEVVDSIGDEQDTLQVRYTEVIPFLVKAIQEQQTIINDLKARIETLEAK